MSAAEGVQKVSGKRLSEGLIPCIDTGALTLLGKKSYFVLQANPTDPAS